ncbi:hypothetical protein MLY41_01030, partial [Escherichia coli]|nr:hypothetical protein [Escherichia coli]
FNGLCVSSPAQPSPAQPSPAQPSPAQPSPNKPNAVFSLQIVTYIIRQISLLSEINKHWQRLSLSNTHHY